MRRSFALAAVAAAAAAALAVSRPGGAAYPGGRGMLAWATTACSGDVASRSRTFSIVTANADGSGRRPLSCNDADSPYQDVAAVWSPDGNRLAVVRCANGAFGCDMTIAIDVMDWDGRNRRPLVAEGTEPTWSPDGTVIAFTAFAFAANGTVTSELWRVDADGTDATHIPVPGCTQVGSPRWGATPAGERILVRAYCDRSWALYSVLPDGRGRTLVRADQALGTVVWDWDWAPDGTGIVFAEANAPDHPGFPEVYRLAPVSPSGAATRLTTTADRPVVGAYDAVYAPDGGAIAFTASGDDPFGEIWIMGAGGESPAPVTRDDADDSDPSWQPCRAGVTLSCVSVAPPQQPAGRLFVDAFTTVPAVARAGRTFAARLVAVDAAGVRPQRATVECTARVGGRVEPLALLARTFTNARAACLWRVPRATRGRVLRGSIAVRVSDAVVRTSFARRVR